MNRTKVIALAASLLLAGAAAASAATNPSMSKPADAASANLSLNHSQQQKAWKDLYMQSVNQKAPSGFTVRVGATVPKSVTTAPVTTRAARDVPTIKSYDFANLQHKLVIVNPSNDRIVDVISG